MKASPMSFLQALRNDQIETLADSILGEVSKERFGALIPLADHPSSVSDDDGVLIHGPNVSFLTAG
jgi:hypothetical protein